MKRPLGVFENTQAFFNHRFPFNAVVVLRLSGAPAVDTLKKAIVWLRQRHPLLGVRIHDVNGVSCFDTDAVPPNPFLCFPRNSAQDWQAMVEKELEKPFDLKQGPLFRAVYLEPSGSVRMAELVLSFQHTIMDAASGTSLIAELLRLCADLEAGMKLPEVYLQAFPPAADTHFTASMMRGKSRFMLRQLIDELKFQWFSRGKRQPPVYARGHSRILPLQFSEQSTVGLIRFCRRHRVTLNSALVAALLVVAQQQLYGNEERLLRHFVFANLRPYVMPPISAENLGSCFAMLRFTTRVTENSGFWALAKAVNAQVYKAAKAGEKYHSLLTSRMVMKMLLAQNRFRMGHTALSYTGVANLPADYGDIKLEGLHAFVSNCVLGPEFTAQVRIFNARLWWDFVYLDCDMDANRAYELAQEVLLLLEESSHAG